MGGVTINRSTSNNEELLKYAIENDMIDLSYMQDIYEMNKRNELLKKHQNKIWQGKDGKWYTYIPDKDGNRKLKKRSTRKDIEDMIIGYLKEVDKRQATTFKIVFWEWLEFQKNIVSDNTIKKAQSDYKRFFQGEEFENIPIENITEEIIIAFISSKTKKLQLCKKSLKALYGYVNSVFHSAKVNKLVKDNPMDCIRAKQFFKFCKEKEKKVEDRIVSEKEMQKLYESIYRDYREKPDYIPTYAVELATLTGMRVGELAALRWDRISRDYLVIDQSEKYNRMTKEFYIDSTKNGKDRVFPMTDEIWDVLIRLKKVEAKNDFLCEWVFSNQNGRIHAGTISDCARNKFIQNGMKPKSIHALRRTVNSRLRCNGVSSTVAASLLGHTTEVNENNYTYDIFDIGMKKGIVESVSIKKAISI